MAILQSTMKLTVGAHKLLLDIRVDSMVGSRVGVFSGLFLVVVGHPCYGSTTGGYSTKIGYVEAVLGKTRDALSTEVCEGGSGRKGGGYREQPLWWAE